MKKLQLPIVKEKLSDAPVLSMDDYHKFVMMNIELGLVDLEAARAEKRSRPPTVPFCLKEPVARVSRTRRP